MAEQRAPTAAERRIVPSFVYQAVEDYRAAVDAHRGNSNTATALRRHDAESALMIAIAQAIREALANPAALAATTTQRESAGGE